jgi:choline dehydrogenase-like flavoprotein
MVFIWSIISCVTLAMAGAQEYDFVIVGGGTAGLVLANRLSANPEWTVAVIEAGGDVSADPRVLIPALFAAAAGSDIDWGIASTPQVRVRNTAIKPGTNVRIEWLLTSIVGRTLWATYRPSPR